MEDRLALTEMLDFVDHKAERAAQEAEEDELLLLNMDGSPWTLTVDTETD